MKKEKKKRIGESESLVSLPHEWRKTEIASARFSSWRFILVFVVVSFESFIFVFLFLILDFTLS